MASDVLVKMSMPSQLSESALKPEGILLSHRPPKEREAAREQEVAVEGKNGET